MELTLHSFYMDKNNSIHIAFYKGDNKDIRQYAHFDNKSKIWINEETKEFQLDSDDVSFEKNIVSVKKDNKTIFTKELPTATGIENALNISLYPSYITYSTYRDLLNLRWDKKSYIISALDANKEKIYYIYMEDLNGSFSYQIQNKSVTLDTSSISSFGDGLSLYSFDTLNDYSQRDKYLKYSIDSKAPLCFTYWDKFHVELGTIGHNCYIRKNTKLIKKDIFDIYPMYKDTYINKSKAVVLLDYRMYDGILKIFFDTKNNMHMFYNDPNDLTGKYFYYEMYSPNEPTIPKYKQKIYWR